MKNKILAAIFSLSSAILIAQDFRISPSNAVNTSLEDSQPSRTEIFFENITNTAITLHWELIANNLVSGWNSYICDDDSCYQGVPKKGTMNSVGPGVQVYLSLYVNTKAIPGDGTLKLSIYEEGDSINKDTLTWMIHSSSGLGINEPGRKANIKVFPNPAFEYITVDLSAYPTGMENTLYVYNSVGQEIMKKNIASNSTIEKLDITSLSKGTYQLMINADAKKQLSKTFIKQ